MFLFFLIFSFLFKYYEWMMRLAWPLVGSVCALVWMLQMLHLLINLVGSFICLIFSLALELHPCIFEYLQRLRGKLRWKAEDRSKLFQRKYTCYLCGLWRLNSLKFFYFFFFFSIMPYPWFFFLSLKFKFDLENLIFLTNPLRGKP